MFRSIVLRAVLLAASGALPAASLAATTSAELTSLIDRAASASEATVLLVPPMTLYRSAVTETRLESVACRYATSDPAAVRALVVLFRDAEVRVDRVYQALDLREGVYLTMADGSLLKFFLQDNFGGSLPVKGLAEVSASGTVQSMTITAKRTLAADLRAWAVKFAAAGDGCDRAAPARADPVEMLR